MIDVNNTFFIVEDLDNVLYKMPVGTLGDLIAICNEENEKVSKLIEAIDELSAYLLDLSGDFVDEHYSLEELSVNFEFTSETDAMTTDKSILTENDVHRYVNDKNIIFKDTVDSMYDDEESDADNVFDKIDDESDKYYD